MIEVEGKDKEKFFDLFEEEYEKICDNDKENDFEYRPDKRNIAIAFKEMDNFFSLNCEEENKMIEEISSWKFIDEAIENALSKF